MSVEASQIPTLTDAVDMSAVPSIDRLAALSVRERQVLNLSAAGHRIKHIADQLKLSVKTVSTYKLRVCQKMRVRTTVEWMNLLRSIPVPS